MKPARAMTTLLALALLAAPCVASVADAKTAAPRTITQVVDLLQDMLSKSKTTGNEEREMYAKYKCYCDTNKEEKTAEIESLTEEIAILESKIEELQASNGELSSQVAKLKADMAANEDSRNQADSIRTKEKTEFLALETDLDNAISQMDEAIKTLAEIGADQSLGESAADHKYMMAQPSALLAEKLRKSVKQALVAASSMVTKKQRQQVESFLQSKAPFTGTYTSQSGEVVGILKDMRDTFKANLATARATEAKAKEAHDKFMKTALAAYDEMDASHTEKQGQLGSNDSDLSTKKTQLSQAVTDKAEAETFLDQLLDMCSAKAKEYKERTMLRTQEEAAIAEAISILNSDAAFATFGSVDATKTGATSFLQRSRVHRHRQAAMVLSSDIKRQAATKFLAPLSKKSVRVAKVTALLVAKNPFKTVLEEIKKMLALIDEEEKKDDEQKKWCDSERSETNTQIDTKKDEITTLNSDINTLDSAINDPVTGLKVSISTDESLLEENIKDQKTETADRTEDNLRYQKDIANLQEAQALLQKALTVLDKYYSKILKPTLVQKAKHAQPSQPSPPPTFSGNYKGQSEAGGTSAIQMLEFILSETQKEEAAAHTAEKDAQHDFEDSMTTLKEQQALLLKSIASLKEQLAEKEEELLGKKTDLAATEKEKAALEAYLLKIKPGCDFITENIASRKAARVDEKAALNTATNLIKGTPAYLTAETQKHEESLGACKDICKPNEAHVECKACLAKTSIPGYCAGHPGTAGC